MFATSTAIGLLIEIPKLVIVTEAKTLASFFWMLVKALWFPYWPFIIIFILAWVIIELATRNGRFHYNSRNGFSPAFNRVVGSGVLALFQGLTYLIIKKISGVEVYDNLWPYPVHLFSFIMTGLFLNLTGFWVYWKLPRI